MKQRNQKGPGLLSRLLNAVILFFALLFPCSRYGSTFFLTYQRSFSR